MRKTILASDQSGKEIQSGSGATLRINFDDQRRPTREADLTAEEAQAIAEQVKARTVARRGRRPAKA